MTIQVDFPPDVEARLREEAARRGQDTAEFVRQVVERELMQQALLALRDRKRPQSLDELKPRIPSPSGTSWLAQVVGQWPGDESDEEISKALEELS
jgi:hypothetical protein